MATKRIVWSEEEWGKLAMALHVAHPDLDLFRSSDLKGLERQHALAAMKKVLPKARQRDIDTWKLRAPLLETYARLRARQVEEVAGKEPPPAAPSQPAQEPAPAASESAPAAVESAAPNAGARKGGHPHVQWSESEWYALAAEMHRQNPFANYLTSETLAGLQLTAIKSAMSIFAPERRRNLTTTTACKPYLLRAFKLVKQDVARELADQRAQGEAAPTPAPVTEAAPEPIAAPVVIEPAAPATIDALVAQLGARLADTFASAFIATFTSKFKDAFQNTIPAAMGVPAPAPAEPGAPLRIETLAQPPAPATVTPIRPPHILVVGPLPVQGAELERCYPQVKFSILKDDASNLKALAAQCDRAIGMTSFMSHSVDSKLKKAAGERYARCTGGVSAIKHLLDVWIAEGIVPPRPQLAA